MSNSATQHIGKLGGRKQRQANQAQCEADAALVKRLLAGDQSAFTALVDTHHTKLLRLARTFVQDGATAEEVVQDTWMGVLKGLHSFEGRSTLKTWIFRILTNRAQTRAKREGRSIAFSALVGPDEEPAVDPARFAKNGRWADPPKAWVSHTPEKQALLGEARAVIEEAIKELPPNQRAVVTLRDIEGLSPEDVCSTLEISESNHRVLLHRGRSKLRTALERRLNAS